MSGDAPARRPVRRSQAVNPTGRHAFFEAPPTAAPDTLRAGRADRDGRSALFSSGPRETGTVLVDCSGCGARRRISLAEVTVRLLTFSAYLPLVRRDHPHRMRCPECNQRTWCRIGWND